MSQKRAGKYGLRKDYKGFVDGIGGLKCPCCGSEPYSKVRKHKNKLEKEDEVAREAGEEDCEGLLSCGAGEEQSDENPLKGE